ncbi:MAG: hypothetical protein WC581_01475 [Thermodesulfovibrionales bacterium]
MIRLRYIFSNISALNIALTAVVLLFFNYLVYPMFTLQNLYVLPAWKKSQSPQKEKASGPSPALPADYIMISEANLFHPERKIPAEKKAAEQQQQLPKPEFVLYGTLIFDDAGIAFLEDMKAPRNTTGRGKRQTALKKGDTLSGFILKEIDVDKVVLVRGDEKYTILVHDMQRQKVRESTAKAATTPRSPATSMAPAQVSPQTAQERREIRSRLQPLTTLPISPKQPERIETEILQPQNAEEQSIINFIEKGRQNK